MKVIEHARNVHEIILTENNKIAMLSDVHWDNPKCKLELLKKDLDYCKANNIPVMLNGDTFCLMQGKWDPRGTKSDIRPEHNGINYLDLVIKTAVDFFSPYADIITVVGYGNHETSILKRHETDMIRRFVDLMNLANNTNICTGGYGGWLIVRHEYRPGVLSTFKGKYFHGSGGGGIVTRGEINLTRALEMYEDFDFFIMGHIHENKATNIVRDTLDYHPAKGYYVHHRPMHLAITGTYKEEYIDGAQGWHIERGAPPKLVGGRIMEFQTKREVKDKVEKVIRRIDSTSFPI
jgi:hypothetical protein